MTWTGKNEVLDEVIGCAELERMLEDVGDDPVKRCRLEYLLALQYQNKGDEAKFQEFLEKSGQHSMAVNA